MQFIVDYLLPALMGQYATHDWAFVQVALQEVKLAAEAKSAPAAVLAAEGKLAAAWTAAINSIYGCNDNSKL